MKNFTIPAVLVLFILAGCTSLKPENFSGSKPILNPVDYFSGRTHSAGVIESRNGKPSERITTKTTGSVINGSLSVTQDLYPEKGKHKRRTFNIKPVDEHHVESTGSFIGGTARGKFYGNYFTWRFRLKIADKGLVKHVNMTQHMYLMSDGKTLIIRSVVRKFGLIVKEITEQFYKED